jgi:ligand-binding SRPBCC domain-containing protein
MRQYGEVPVSGKTTGLMNLNDTVTWKARHLLKERLLQVRITAFSRPHFFVDEQVAGDFKMMKHEHHFKAIQNGTLMIDQFRFHSPFGTIGNMLDSIYLEGYMKGLLETRNKVLKEIAEGREWQQYLMD